MDDAVTHPPVHGIPALGLGTWKNTDFGACVGSVRHALDVGYRHIDTAQYYGNEEAVGEGIRTSTVPRKDIFLASKVWFDNLAYEDVIRTTKASLDRLRVESVDMMYVHWPADEYDPEETLAAFAALRDDGLVSHIGVSNFTPELLSEARETCDAPISANQVEMHPLLQQPELREYCARHDIALVAYSPLMHGDVEEIPQVREVAAKHETTPEQVTLAWLLEKGVVPIPKATGRAHIEQNWESQFLDLDAEDVALIDGIQQERRLGDPQFAPW
ncbi:aldo/keto reductase [Haladaptatus sp. DYSN1]|uniref:aldo/keto reductase n=1 Tax=unclassified Haladaptatus TaxID=2622732 RepID=UPI002406E2B9|nr:aldo/keto reductase [Haladaptatus sp. DYSN1]